MLPVDVGLSVPKLGIPTDGEVPLNGIIENKNLINNNPLWLISCMLKLLSTTIQNNQNNQNNSGHYQMSKFVSAT